MGGSSWLSAPMGSPAAAQTLPEVASSQGTPHLVAEQGRGGKVALSAQWGTTLTHKSVSRAPGWGWPRPVGPPPLTTPSPQSGFPPSFHRC